MQVKNFTLPLNLQDFVGAERYAKLVKVVTTVVSHVANPNVPAKTAPLRARRQLDGSGRELVAYGGQSRTMISVRVEYSDAGIGYCDEACVTDGFTNTIRPIIRAASYEQAEYQEGPYRVVTVRLDGSINVLKGCSFAQVGGSLLSGGGGRPCPLLLATAQLAPYWSSSLILTARDCSFTQIDTETARAVSAAKAQHGGLNTETFDHQVRRRRVCDAPPCSPARERGPLVLAHMPY